MRRSPSTPPFEEARESSSSPAQAPMSSGELQMERCTTPAAAALRSATKGATSGGGHDIPPRLAPTRREARKTSPPHVKGVEGGAAPREGAPWRPGDAGKPTPKRTPPPSAPPPFSK